jgi:hypothetical protein
MSTPAFTMNEATNEKGISIASVYEGHVRSRSANRAVVGVTLDRSGRPSSSYCERFVFREYDSGRLKPLPFTAITFKDIWCIQWLYSLLFPAPFQEEKYAHEVDIDAATQHGNLQEYEYEVFNEDEDLHYQLCDCGNICKECSLLKCEKCFIDGCIECMGMEHCDKCGEGHCDDCSGFFCLDCGKAFCLLVHHSSVAEYLNIQSVQHAQIQ